MDRQWSRTLLGQRIRMAREKAGYTRAEMCKMTGITRSTLERMEDGMSPIELCDFYNIYAACNINCQHDFFLLTNPKIMEDMEKDSDFPDNVPDYHKKWDMAYKAHQELTASFSLEEILTTNYISAAEYGGDRYAVLQTFLAYAQLPLEKRDLICGIIMDQWEDSEYKSLLPKNAPKINLKYIKEARRRAKESHRNGETSYL